MSALKLSDFAILKEQPSPKIRAALAEQIAAAFNERQFSGSEVLLAREIISLLASDVEIRIRAILSSHLKENPDIPHEVVLKFARDAEQVATPMLEFSPILSEDDLVEIVRSTRETRKLIAVARRKFLPIKASEALVETGNTAAATALFSNASSDISEESLLRAFSLYHHNETVLDSLIDRGGLALSLAQRFVTSLTLNLQRKLATQYGISHHTASKAADMVRASVTMDLFEKSHSEDEGTEIIQHLYETEQLTHVFLIKALCNGRFDLCEVAFAELAHIPVANAHKLLFEGKSQGFEALYCACQLPESLYAATEMLLRCALEAKQNPGTAPFKQKVLERILERGCQNSIPHMPYVVGLLSNGNTEAQSQS